MCSVAASSCAVITEGWTWCSNPWCLSRRCALIIDGIIASSPGGPLFPSPWYRSCALPEAGRQAPPGQPPRREGSPRRPAPPGRRCVAEDLSGPATPRLATGCAFSQVIHWCVSSTTASWCDPAGISSVRSCSSLASMKMGTPKSASGGSAPRSQGSNSGANSCSLTSSTRRPVASSSAARLSRSDAATTASARFPSILTTTGLATRWPETCSRAASSWAVMAARWTWCSNPWCFCRRCASIFDGIMTSSGGGSLSRLTDPAPHGEAADRPHSATSPRDRGAPARAGTPSRLTSGLAPGVRRP